MSADLDTSITLRGEKEELLAMLKVLKEFDMDTETLFQYRQTHPIYGYIEWVEVLGNSQKRELKSMNEADLQDFISKAGNELSVHAMGPWGNYGLPEDLGLFEALAEAAPNAYFEGAINGFITGADVGHYGTLENGLLCLQNYYKSDECYDEDDEDDGFSEEYIKYFKKKISRVKFCKLFKIDKDEFDMECYEEFIAEAMEHSFPIKGHDLDYDTFVELCDSEIDEEQYAKALKTLEELEMMDFEKFCESADEMFLSSPEYYDPITKKYKKSKK